MLGQKLSCIYHASYKMQPLKEIVSLWISPIHIFSHQDELKSLEKSCDFLPQKICILKLRAILDCKAIYSLPQCK